MRPLAAAIAGAAAVTPAVASGELRQGLPVFLQTSALTMNVSRNSCEVCLIMGDLYVPRLCRHHCFPTGAMP
jgi:hypothetical protein